MSASTIGFDTTTLVLLLAIALGGLGMKRGVRTEGITLAGVLGAAIVFGTDGMRERLIRTIAQLPRVLQLLISPDTAGASTASTAPTLLKNPDEKLVFSALFFVISVILFYLLGSRYGGRPAARTERIIGGVMGAVSGFAVGLTLTGLGQSYLSRRSGAGWGAITFPSIQAPSLAAGTGLAQYIPLVFLVAIGVVAVLAITSFLRARQ